MQLSQETLGSLRSRLQGAVYLPGDPDYDGARAAWNLRVNQRPAIIAAAEDSADVEEAVRFARQHGLGVAVMATGHGVIRPADGCLLIVTSKMNGALVEAKSRIAWVEAGAKWGTVLEKAQDEGLAPLLGSSPDVGAVAYTLGGGMGWLARKYGLAADSVRFFDLITADGQRVRASRTENADLFWGLRGGGGSLGIVTGMGIDLYPVTTVYAGNLLYPPQQAGEVFRRYRDWAASAPDELTSSIVIMNYPPFEMVPEPLRGRTFVQVRGCCCGPVEQGEELLRFWRDWQTPLFDDFRARSFREAAQISNDPVDPVPGMSTGAWLRELSDDAIDTLIRYGIPEGERSPLVVVEVRHAGGAMARVDAQESACSSHQEEHILQIVAMAPAPEAEEGIRQTINRLRRDLQPALTGGVYLNFLEGNEAQERVRDGYAPESYRRLAELKARYDPDNLFRYGRNFAPAVD
jgi:FAD/FMN-containing dehydrogenase